MSFKALSWAWEANTGSPGRKLVLVGLAQFANDKNECWPSQVTIAERTEQSERTVREHLAWLEENGFLSRQARTAAGKQFDSDIIRLHLDQLEPRAKEERRPAANFAGGEPVQPSGEKPQEPAANFAKTQRQISPPNLHTNLQNESPTPPVVPQGGPPAQVLQVVEIWNSGIEGSGLPNARPTEKRNRVIGARLKERGWLEDFRVAVSVVAASPWHRGGNDRGWMADIDYLLQAGKATQLAEKAGAKPIRAAPKGPAFRSAADTALAQQLERRTNDTRNAAAPNQERAGLPAANSQHGGSVPPPAW